MLENIKRLRIDAHLSQAELAEKVFVTRSAVALWETGRSSPTSDRLPALAQALGCSIDNLYTEEEKEVS